MQTTLLLIRHGETEYNKAGIIQGHVDSPLTAEGREQARKLGRRLVGKSINALWHSDLGRAVETTQLLGLDLMGQADGRLREIHCGMADGRDFREIKRAHPDFYAQWHSENPHFCFPEGESFMQVQDRMFAAIREIAEQNEGKAVAIVSHGTALRLFLKKIVDIPLGQPTGWYLRNTSVTRVELDAEGKWRLMSFGDVAHLEDF